MHTEVRWLSNGNTLVRLAQMWHICTKHENAGL